MLSPSGTAACSAGWKQVQALAPLTCLLDKGQQSGYDGKNGVAICWIERDIPMDKEHVQRSPGRRPWYRRAFSCGQRHEQTGPSLAAPFAEQPLTEQPLAGAMQVRRILIVEDEAGAASAIQEALEIEGGGQWKAQIARSGEEALLVLENQPVDLILLDVRLPGISGAEVHRRLRARPETRHLPIIFLSGATSFDLSVAGIEEGVLLRKPFQIPDLLAMVNANLPPLNDPPGALASDAGV